MAEKRGTQMGKQILLVNDLPGYGKVALAAMMPVLAHMGHITYNLPTALVSNTLDYGKFEIQDTTHFMRNTLKVWQELGFTFDAISTGFIVSHEQAELLSSYCSEKRKTGTKIFVDPIMGDEGHLYNGLTEDTVKEMRELARNADYMVPNYTEAALIAGAAYKAEGLTWEEAKALLNKLHAMSQGSVIITSAKVDGEDAVAGYDAARDEYFLRTFTMVPIRFPGTGDIFSSIFMGEILNGKPLIRSVESVDYDPTGLFSSSSGFSTLVAGTDYTVDPDGYRIHMIMAWPMSFPIPCKPLRVTYLGGYAWHTDRTVYAVDAVTGTPAPGKYEQADGRIFELVSYDSVLGRVTFKADTGTPHSAKAGTRVCIIAGGPQT